MSRKLNYNITRFDGGITDDIRSSDLSKCAHVSHFDIYGEPHHMKTMPGFLADQDYEGVADDLQQFNIRAFNYKEDGTLVAVGDKANGTGTHLVHKATPTTAEWSNGVTSTSGTTEGADDLMPAPLANIIRDTASVALFFPTTASGNTYFSTVQVTAPVTDKDTTLQTSYTPTEAPRFIQAKATGARTFTNNLKDDVVEVDNTSVTDPAYNIPTVVTDITPWASGVWVMGYELHPRSTSLLLWDMASAVADQAITIPNSKGGAIGTVGSAVVVAIDEFIDTSKGATEAAEYTNGGSAFSVRVINGSAVDTLYRYTAPTQSGGKLWPTKSTHKDGFTFYGKFATDSAGTTFNEGLWTVGRKNSGSQLALSLLLDTTALGQIDGYYGFGQHHFFAHGGDGSVSRLDAYDDGAYDVIAVWESLLLGSESPNKKSFDGFSVVTEDLPTGGQVEVKYRFDTDDAWTSFGTSTTVGEERHTFTKVNGEPIGNAQEMQFQLLVTGKVVVKSIGISLTELDDLPY